MVIPFTPILRVVVVIRGRLVVLKQKSEKSFLYQERARASKDE